jgi:CHAT domain-containing protein
LLILILTFDPGRELELGREATGQDARHNFTRRDLDAMELFPLPGTAKEAGALQATATTAGWRTEIYCGKAATESELRKVQSSRILHLATHAFFLPVDATQAPLQAGQGGVSGARPNPEVVPMIGTGQARNPPKQVVIENPM